MMIIAFSLHHQPVNCLLYACIKVYVRQHVCKLPVIMKFVHSIGVSHVYYILYTYWPVLCLIRILCMCMELLNVVGVLQNKMAVGS